MCEIHFIYKKKKLKRKDLDEFMKMMCFGSIRKHKDAWGFFTDKTAFRESGEFDPSAMNIYSLRSKFIVGHNRLSTGGIGPIWNIGKAKPGKNTENLQHHPFELGDFLMVHNGIISNAKSLFKKYKIQTPIETDSFAIIYLIFHYFKESKEVSRQEKIIDAIRETIKKLNGWYSIILYDKKSNKIYYFRDSITIFNFCTINDSLLIGSTSGENIDYTYFNEDKKDFIPKPNVIYLLGNYGGGRFFKEVGRLKYKDMGNIKKEFMSEKPGEIYKLISNLPGKPINYEISENLKIKIPYIDNESQNKLLRNYLNSKRIKFIVRDNSFILNLGDIK